MNTPVIQNYFVSWNARASVIYRATKQHAFNLAKFVSIYKALLLVQKKMNSGKERNIDTFIAGLIGGYFVFGDRNAVNEQVLFQFWISGNNLSRNYQIVLYVISRVLASFLPRANQSSASSRSASGVQPIPPDSKYFTVFAALSWGAVMYLFRHRAETIQRGMFNSMTYLYRDSEVWSDLRTLLWHNT